MTKKSFQFSSKKVHYYFDASLSDLKKLTDRKNTIVITDEHVAEAHSAKLGGFRQIIIPAGEQHKIQSTVDHILSQLIEMGADRETVLIGMGGGVVTDLTGYVASIYMRGIAFGFIPTSILAMVDASIGGKNGIDIGPYKNMAGIIRQPDFLLYDVNLLRSLPDEEWINGFAEIIKHACIKDAVMFRELQQASIQHFMRRKTDLSSLIRKNAIIKSRVVQRDEFEQGERRLLNFGHTFGHAIETSAGLPHGHAISLGMVIAAGFSQEILKFRHKAKLTQVLEQFGLPVEMDFDREESFRILQMDKKKSGKDIRFILLEKIGKGIVYPLPIDTIHRLYN